MRRSIKKAIAFILFLAMTMQLVSFTSPKAANAAGLLKEAKAIEASTDDPDYYISDGSMWGYYGDAEELIIPEGITSVSLYGCDSVKTINVPEGVTSVSISSFQNLKTLTLSSTVSYVYVYGCPELTDLDLSVINMDDYPYVWLSSLNISNINAKGIKGYLGIYDLSKLLSLDLSDADLDTLSIEYCKNLKELKVGNVAYSLTLDDLPSLKSATVPGTVKYLYLKEVAFDKINVNGNKNKVDNYYIENGGLYRLEENYNGIIQLRLKAIDGTLKTINVKDGTEFIDYLNLSYSGYKVKTINLPDSVEVIGTNAFYGGSTIKELNLPKNVITLGYYAFSNVAVDTIVIPASVKYVDDNCFGGYTGKVTVEKNTDYVSEYEGGIYRNAISEDGDILFTSLVYYDPSKTSVKFKEGTTFIGQDVFENSKVKELNLPEGLDYADLYLYGAKNLKSITIPSSVYYIGEETVVTAPNLKTFKVSADNQYYASKDNCLYDKDMCTFYCAPATKDVVTIPEGVISLSYYALAYTYVMDPDSDDNWKLVSHTYKLPRSLENYSTYYDLNFKKLYLWADTDLAGLLQLYNQNERDWAEEYGYDPYVYDYELRDTNKSLLNSIYVVDSLTIKKGKKKTATVELPAGLDRVTALTLGKNTECQVKFSSSDKSIAKVNSKTGVITGVKAGTCTINVKCTIDNGKKKNTKTFKIKVKIK